VSGSSVAAGADVAGPILDDEARELADVLVRRYPDRRSALMPLLYLVQSRVGWVPRQGLREIADILDLTTAEVEAVASFYTMVKLRPCGAYVLSICTNPSCSLVGGRRLFERARELLGPSAEHGVTDDGLLTLEEEECMAACDKAPVAALNYVYFDRVTEERLQEMIDGVRRGDVPEAARGGVPGDLRSVSGVLAGLGAQGGEAGADG
jgi:NADH-quinone oxidoreductase subunit E